MRVKVRPGLHPNSCYGRSCVTVVTRGEAYALLTSERKPLENLLGDVMPKKLYPSEPAVIFQELFKTALHADNDFLIRTPDPSYESFADKLIAEHFPPQSQLPLTD